MGQHGQSDLPEKVCKNGHGTVSTRERMWHQRVGERPCARNGEHSRPPPSPNEERGPLVGDDALPVLELPPNCPRTRRLQDSIFLQFPCPPPRDGTCRQKATRRTSFPSLLVLWRTQCRPQQQLLGRGMPEAVRTHIRVVSTAKRAP